MTARWFAHLDAHIATGQVAVEAESAELLGELLKLEPEQRWCLLLRRDPRLARLVAVDYRRLLTLMVELESGAIAAAPIPPQPCIDHASAPLALPYLEPTSPKGARRILWPLGLSLLALTGAAGGMWLSSQDGRQHLSHLGQTAQTWWRTRNVTGADREGALAWQILDSEHQRRAMVAFVVLETLSRKLADGQPFATELAALNRLWPEPAQLAFLDALAAQDPAEPVALRAELARLNADLTRQRGEWTQLAQYGRLSPADYAARVQPLETLRDQAEAALTQAGQGAWRAALEALPEVEDPAYRNWRERVQRWLETQDAVSELARQAWSQWTSGLPNAPPPNSPQPDTLQAGTPKAPPS
ncbi:hypothetical protein [Thiocystis violascens]|uniref:Uncharacterized protein n=1 Tax=Thiocystis violascens (strain ATCC 17096 / DSM 198 / 6111) TaxID=765911 RepID=I3Y7T0_THIV6|nr:hypothetical protein [Thiocystis violascens]AFL73048.1 hypothetical protein Thivi_1017 [Thiocystis violascens DSM 198]